MSSIRNERVSARCQIQFTSRPSSVTNWMSWAKSYDDLMRRLSNLPRKSPLWTVTRSTEMRLKAARPTLMRASRHASTGHFSTPNDAQTTRTILLLVKELNKTIALSSGNQRSADRAGAERKRRQTMADLADAEAMAAVASVAGLKEFHQLALRILKEMMELLSQTINTQES